MGSGVEEVEWACGIVAYNAINVKPFYGDGNPLPDPPLRRRELLISPPPKGEG